MKSRAGMHDRRPTPAMAVALLALFVALGGTGYAVSKLPANSVGSKQLRENAVTSSKVKNHSLKAVDFAAGQLPKGVQGPPGPTFAATAMGSNGEHPADPAVTPDESSATATTNGQHFDFTLPASGKLYVRFFQPFWAVSCTSGTALFGLYLDGAPVAKSAHTLPPSPNAQARESVVVVSAGAGAHSLEARVDCPGGTISGENVNNVPDWTVMLLSS
jgi:hypothetical protein